MLASGTGQGKQPACFTPAKKAHAADGRVGQHQHDEEKKEHQVQHALRQQRPHERQLLYEEQAPAHQQVRRHCVDEHEGRDGDRHEPVTAQLVIEPAPERRVLGSGLGEVARAVVTYP